MQQRISDVMSQFVTINFKCQRTTTTTLQNHQLILFGDRVCEQLALTVEWLGMKMTTSKLLVQCQTITPPGNMVLCLQCFDAVGWAAGRASGL